MAPPDEHRSQDARPAVEPAFAELRARLDVDLDALNQAIAGIDQAQADWKPSLSGWSVGETIHHLVLSNRTFALVARKLVQQGRREGLTARPEGRRSWPRLRSVADVAVSGPARNPERVTPTHGLPIEKLRRDLVDSHGAVEAMIPALAGLDIEALHLPHPFGFELNLFQWIDIAGAHERRHLEQIRRTLAAPGFPTRRA